MRISLVAPAFNEEEAIPLFVAHTEAVLGSLNHEIEFVFVDDGSTDGTLDILKGLAAVNPHVRVLSFSKNFGKEAALTAGLQHASGDVVIPIDCDLQDPPELIPTMIAEWEAGYKVVLAIRDDRSSDSWMKRKAAGAFYKVMTLISDVAIPENAGDFRLMDRSVVTALLGFPERARFMKGLMAACGFKTTTVRYARPNRVAGSSKFKAWRLWNFALDGITSFSTLPLRVWTYLGFSTAVLALIYAGWVVFKTLVFGVVTPGYATLITVSLVLGGLQMIGIGVIGEYLGRVVIETKRRPMFIVDAVHGFPEPPRVVKSLRTDDPFSGHACPPGQRVA